MKTVSAVSNTTKNLLTYDLLEPLDGVMTAKVDINTGAGNLTIDRLTGSEHLLASGALEYTEKQGFPTRTLTTINGQATLRLSAGDPGRPWFRFPWAACNGATEWQIHISPFVQADISARSGGGNVQLNLAGMAVTRVSADSGGGNMDVVLPDNAADLDVTARTGGGNVAVEIGSGTTGSGAVTATSGAGNVVVRVPNGIAAHIHADTGMGKAIIDPRFVKIDKNTYQSPNFDTAADKVEITVHSGAGNVSVSAK